MIPEYQVLMLPLLEFARDGKGHTLGEAREFLAEKFGLTEEERKGLLCNNQSVFHSRVHCAKTYLVQPGLLESVRRGVF